MRRFAVYTLIPLIACGLLLGACGVGPDEDMKRNDDNIPARAPRRTSGPGLVADYSVTEEAISRFAVMPVPLNGSFDTYSKGYGYEPDHWVVDTTLGPTASWGTHALSYTTDYHTGGSCLRLLPTVNTYLVTDAFSMPAGQIPIVSLYFKVLATGAGTGGGANRIFVDIQYLDKDGNSLTVITLGPVAPANAYFGATPTAWIYGASTVASGSSTVSPDGTKSAKVRVYTGASASLDILLDDLVVTIRTPQEAFTDVTTFGGTWVNYGAPLDKAGYMLDSMGFVHLRGAIKTGVLLTAAFTLPAGYRPNNTKRVIGSSAGGAVSEIDIAGATGVVTINTGNNALISLEGITFQAQQ